MLEVRRGLDSFVNGLSPIRSARKKVLRGLKLYDNVKPNLEVKILIDIIGYSSFFMIFVSIPIMFAISLLREPSKVEWPTVEIDYERDKCESYIEIKLYDALLFNKYDVKTQVPCGRYRIDLALPESRLAIECDGKAFHSTKEQKAHDYRKNAYLRKNGWKVLRFSGSRIHRDLAGVLRKVENVVSADEYSHLK